MSTTNERGYQQVWFGTGVSWLSRVITKPVFIGGSLALIYLMTLTTNYFWDGITFASCIEKVSDGQDGAARLFHQNHLLYSAVGYLLYCAARGAGLSLRALTVLQLANVVFGSFAISVFFQIAQRIMRNRYAAALSSIALGLSAVWWKLSTDADAYILAVLLILLCLKNLLGPTPRWYLAGSSLAGAMLIHELASLFFVAAILAVFSNKDIQQRLRFASWMSGLAWLITIGVYYACAAVLHGMTNPFDVVRWAVSNPSRSVPSLNPIQGMLGAPRKNIEAVIGHDFGLFNSRPSLFSSAFGLTAIIAMVALAVKAARTTNFRLLARSLRQEASLRDRWQKPGLTLIAWIIAYAVFLLFWEPADPYYPLFYFPALALLCGLALSRYDLNLARSAAKPSATRSFGTGAFAVVTLALFNLVFFIVPNMQQDSNKLVTAAKSAQDVWYEPTVIYFADHNEADTTFAYFNNRVVWRRVPKASLIEIESQIELAAEQGGSVWLNRGALELIAPEWVARYAGKKLEVEVAWARANYTELSIKP